MFLPSKLPPLGDAVRLGEQLRVRPGGFRRAGERRGDLVGSPDEEAALLALGVGVLRRVEAARRVEHLAHDVVERLGDDAPVAGSPVTCQACR